MNLQFGRNSSLFIFVIFICAYTSEALKCKCTQSSWKTTCEDGICEVDDESGSCLMLNHPISGRHYACSQSPASESECIEKTTKSGAKVTVCSCDTSDFCNFKMWPMESADVVSSQESAQSSLRDGRRELPPPNSASVTAPFLTLFTLTLALLKFFN
uniref:Activin_recp domain-containing protein n=1 Tax=Panagrellus redivivus TaxID=6233 RepID=A0A7E4W622_PANRE